MTEQNLEPKFYFADVSWASQKIPMAPMDIQQAIKNGLVASRQNGRKTEVEIIETIISKRGKALHMFHLNYKKRMP